MAILVEGQTLGKYRVLEPLGRGGMAQVYRAYHPQLDRYAAVKVLRSDLVEESEFLGRFQREARAVAGLRHANIVQVYDFDAQDGLYYMVMELLEGDTLKAQLNYYRTRGERLLQGEMVRILKDVLQGVAYAHAEGIVHRDVKPANIMLTRRGQAVLTDFGVAQIVGGTQYTVSGALMGTLHYMAPEQGLEGHCDSRSDLYSLGIVFYEMLTGRPPFDADTPLAILMKHVNDPLPLPRKVDPAIPELFERIVLKALAKDPEDRYQNAEEMAQALEQAAGDVGVAIPEALTLAQIDLDLGSLSDSAAVFSGEARAQITDAGFAEDDTDITLGERLEAERAEKDDHTPDGGADAGDPRTSGRWRQVLTAVLAPLGVLAAANVAVAILGGAMGASAELFGRSWPMELYLVGLALSLLAMVFQNPWLLIPAGLVLGNGFILAYYAVTGNWSHWVFLWPLEPLLVAITVGGSILLARQGERGRLLTQRVAAALSLVAAFGLPLLLLGAVIATIVS